MPKILITGGTGLIGSNLIKKLKQRNFKTVLLSTQKSRPNNIDTFYWNPELNIFPLIDLKTIDVCINFCGAPIFDKAFTEKRKKDLKSSRVVPISFLLQQFKNTGTVLPFFISVSATGIYPNICLSELDEDSTLGNSFISGLVEQWEHTIHSFSEAYSKQCIFRIGIVLSDQGGFLTQLAKPVRFFVGAVPGSGNQIISWIHIDDLTDMMMHAMEKQLIGTYNAVAPEPDTLGNMTGYIAKILGRPLIFPNIPVWALKLAFGKERHELLLTSQNVSSKKIRETGFRFKFSQSEQAIRDLLIHE